MLGQGGAARVTRDETNRLSQANSRHAGNAVLLLAQLRIDHTARVARGNTFALSAGAMTDANYIPGWTRECYQHAKALLLQTGLPECVSEFRNTGGGRQAAQFTLVRPGRHTEKPKVKISPQCNLPPRPGNAAPPFPREGARQPV